MLNFLRFITYIAGVLVVILIHTTVINVLPFPFNFMNVIFVTLMWLLFYTDSGATPWLTLIFGFLLELFSASPFGFEMIGLFFSVALIRWALNTVLTNHSRAIVAFAGGAGIFCYRLIFYSLFGVYELFHGNNDWFSAAILANVGWEIVLSAAALLIAYVLSAPFISRFNPKYIRARL